MPKPRIFSVLILRAASDFKVLARHTLGGEGGWNGLTADAPDTPTARSAARARRPMKPSSFTRLMGEAR